MSHLPQSLPSLSHLGKFVDEKHLEHPRDSHEREQDRKGTITVFFLSFTTNQLSCYSLNVNIHLIDVLYPIKFSVSTMLS